MTFQYSDPTARKVTLAGEFNEWDKDALAMAKNDTGAWEARLDLEPGIYEYKYVVDGNWDKANKDSRMVKVKKKDLREETGTPAGSQEGAPRQKEMPQLPEIQSEPAQPESPDAAERPKADMRPAVSPVTAAVTKGTSAVDAASLPMMASEHSFAFSSSGKGKAGARPPASTPAHGLTRRTDERSIGRSDDSINPSVPSSIRPSVDPSAEPMPIQSAGGSENEPVTFRYQDPDASSVSVVGDFNGWKPDANPMEKVGGGMWESTLFLAPGNMATSLP